MVKLCNNATKAGPCLKKYEPLILAMTESQTVLAVFGKCEKSLGGKECTILHTIVQDSQCAPDSEDTWKALQGELKGQAFRLAIAG